MIDIRGPQKTWGKTAWHIAWACPMESVESIKLHIIYLKVFTGGLGYYYCKYILLLFYWKHSYASCMQDSWQKVFFKCHQVQDCPEYCQLLSSASSYACNSPIVGWATFVVDGATVVDTAGVESVVGALEIVVVDSCVTVVGAALVDTVVVVAFETDVVRAAVVGGGLTVLLSHWTFSGQSHTCKFWGLNNNHRALINFIYNFWFSKITLNSGLKTVPLPHRSLINLPCAHT